MTRYATAMLAFWTVCLAPSPLQAGKLRLIKSVPGYRIYHAKGDRRTNQLARLVVRDRQDRAPLTVKAFEVQLRVCRDLTGDEVADMIAYTDSGVLGYIRYAYYVYSLGPAVRNLLAFDAASVNQFETCDLDRDGRWEIITRDDSFGYVEWWFLEKRHQRLLPMILGYRNGRFVDVTTQFPQVLRREIEVAKKELRNAGKQDRNSSRGQWPYVMIYNWYAAALLLGEGKQASQDLMTALPTADREWFSMHRQWMRDVVLKDRPAKIGRRPAGTDLEGNVIIEP